MMHDKGENDEGVIFMKALTDEERFEAMGVRARKREVERCIASALWKCLDGTTEAREDFAMAVDESGGPVIPEKTRVMKAPLSLGALQEREVVLIYMGSGEDL